MRAAFDWPMVICDFVGAAIAIHYWSLRRTYGTLMHGAKLFDDLKERQRQAVELNDNVVQGLVAAQLALSLDEREIGAEAVADTLAKARAIITDLLGEAGSELELGPGDLVRAQPAITRPTDVLAPAGHRSPADRPGRRHARDPVPAAPVVRARPDGVGGGRGRQRGRGRRGGLPTRGPTSSSSTWPCR